MNDKKSLRGVVCAVAAGVCWGFSGAVGQFLFTKKGVDSQWLILVRMVAAGALLMLLAAVKHPRQLRAVWHRREDAVRLVAFSLLGLMTCQYTYLTAISYSNSGTATALQFLGQAMILACVCLHTRRLPRPREGAALLLALGGVFLLATHGSLKSLVLSPQALIWGLLAAVALTVYTLIPGDLVARFSCPVCTGYGMFLGGVVLFFLVRGWELTVQWDVTVALCVAEIVVLGTAVPFSLYLQAVSDIGGVKASFFVSTELVSAALFAALWVGTRFAPPDILGIAMIAGMAVLLALPEKAKA